MNFVERFKGDQGLWVTLVGAGVNIFLVLAKFVGGTLGHSTALIADAFHSLSDLLNDVVVIFTYRIGRIPKDEGHPYGHGRAENIGSTIIGVAIVLVGLRILYDVGVVLASGQEVIPSWIAAVVAGMSILAKEIMFRYTKSVGETVKSPAILANAWDQRSDALSSFATLIGIVGAMSGFPIMDPLAGGVVAIMITRVGYQVLNQGLGDLMDSALEEEELKKIEELIRETPGVLALHDMRTRRIGGEFLVDVHIQVNPDILVTEGHNIAETVRRKLITSFNNLLDVLVHVDPEDDMSMEQIHPSSGDDLRQLTEPIIAGTPGIANHSKTRVHYIKGKNIIEIFIQLEGNKTLEEAKQIVSNLKTRLKEVDPVDDVHVYLEVDSKDLN